VIDLRALSAQYYTSAGPCSNAGDSSSTSSAAGQIFCDDHTHFEATGAAHIAGVVAQALKDQGIGLAACLKWSDVGAPGHGSNHRIALTTPQRWRDKRIPR
jgi:hypothetical protein